jgi:hypothetical protein
MRVFRSLLLVAFILGLAAGCGGSNTHGTGPLPKGSKGGPGGTSH